MLVRGAFIENTLDTDFPRFLGGINRMLQHVGRILPLAFSIAALACLAIIFAGCTSTSSPNELYFLKVELTNFPEIGSDHPRRSLGIAAMDGIDVANKASSEANSVMNSASTAVIYASGAAETAASQVTDKIQSLSDEINSHLPGFYSVGLWGYCQGQKETSSYSNCSQPSTSFSFDLLSILGSASPVIDGILPDGNNKVLAGYHGVSRWSISAYILGFVSTFVAVVFGVTTMFFSWGKILLIISSLSATIFVAGASIGVTVIYGLITGAIQSILHPLGADASLGAHSFAATWLAVTFSFAALLTWLIEMFCCCI